MATGDDFLNQKLESITRKITDNKICQQTKFEVLSLDCNPVAGFQISEKLDCMDLGERHLRISRDICMEIGRPLTGHSLV